ncbi:MAG TPA: hypothetical protein DCF91_10330 [Porphyromonadaceae bacterium]|nr:hypothetical protein [Porphyromonadaceae bacterium]
MAVTYNHAQELPQSPSQWSTFVSSDKNLLVEHTLLKQSFENEASDQWEYTTDGTVVSLSTYGINKIDGDKALKLTRNQTFTLETIPTAPYLDYYRQCKNSSRSCRSGASDYAFFIDHIRIVGRANMFTMTTTQGDWNSSGSWTHNRPNAHTSVLVAHNTEIGTHEKCNNLHVGNAALRINSNGNLLVSDNLVIHSQTNSSTNPAFYNEGGLSIQNNLEFHITFDQKAKWVFVSFPHDVYIDDIDNNWSLGDAATTTGGNKFYVRKYNSDKRASDGSSGWQVISTSEVNSTTPLFERNKGYLVAIDQTATEETLPVYIHNEKLTPAFASNATVAISAALHNSNANSEHSGWSLMGNPFPAAITVDYLLSTLGTGYELFSFDGNEYIKLESGNGHIIKPFGAFFIKATQAKTISLNNQKSV